MDSWTRAAINARQPKHDPLAPDSTARTTRVEVGSPASPLLTTDEAATYVRRYHGRPRQFTKFARRWSIPCVYVGLMRFYRRAVLDAFLERNTGRILRLREPRRGA